jgi:hypothetical protein
MQIDAHKDVGRLGKVAQGLLSQNPTASKVLANCELRVGPASNERYGIDVGAYAQPLFVGDSKHFGKEEYDAEISALADKNPDNVTMQWKWNRYDKKFDISFKKIVNDSLVHDANPLISAQALTPWSVNWFKNIFKQPLAWSKFRKFVTFETGTDPWAEVMSLALAQFSGFAALGNAGSPANVKTQDVEVQTGMMTAPIINMDVTYKLAVEELKRIESSQAPWAGSIISQKQEYANWVLEMLTDYVGYYGNAPTGTLGLFTVATPTAWSTISSSMTVLAADAAATYTVGSNMYRAMAKALTSFLTANLNKITKLMIGMSPTAFNLFTSYPYSNVYNPNSAMKIFMENFIAGETIGGTTPDIEIFPDPLLQPSTIFNPLTTDYMVIVAPEIGTGPNEEPQPLTLFGAPLMEFVYPVIPGQFMTQYRMLRRIAGMFVPYTPAVQVYTGFGV